MPEYTPALQRQGIEMLYAPFVTRVKQHLKEQGKRYDLVLLIRTLLPPVNIRLLPLMLALACLALTSL